MLFEKKDDIKRLILVTGATGYVGERLVAALERDGHRVRFWITGQVLGVDGGLARIRTTPGRSPVAGAA